MIMCTHCLSVYSGSKPSLPHTHPHTHTHTHYQAGSQYPLHTAVTCLHSISSVAIVESLLDYGASPNVEEGVPVIPSGQSVQREEQEEGEEKSKSREETANRVTFLVGEGDSEEEEDAVSGGEVA